MKIDTDVAERVMRWHKGATTGVYGLWLAENGGHACTQSSWKPSTNVEQAFQVAEAVNELVRRQHSDDDTHKIAQLHLVKWGEHWYAAFAPHPYGDDGSSWYDVDEDWVSDRRYLHARSYSATNAICRAALMAVDYLVEVLHGAI